MPGNTSTERQSLPLRMKSFFWDYRCRFLRMDRDRDLVIARLFDRGDWNDLKWLRKTLSDSELRHWLISRCGAGLSPPKLRFWELVLRLPRRDVNKWLRNENRRVWDQRARR